MIRLAVRVDRAHAEIALAELLELAPGGVEEVDHGPEVEYVIYGAEGELPDLGDVRGAAGPALLSVSAREVPDDWDERWKEFHRPLILPGRLCVRPPWEPAGQAGSGAEDIVIDPGQAFGTGAHPTTRLCLELLLDLEPGGAFADAGCGSGVLAVLAARRGWAPVLAADFDPLAVEATAANAAFNGVDVSVRRADLRNETMPAAPTVAANLLRPLLLKWCDRLEGPPRALIVSGLLRAEADEVARAFATRHGLREEDRREQGDWAASLLMHRDSNRVPTGVIPIPTGPW